MIDNNSLLVSKEILLKKKLLHFYSNKNNLNIFLPIILQKTRLSLRSLDWFVTNYSKKNNIIISKKDHFNVYLSYRSQLKAYSKQLFDSFRRRDRITFYYDVEKSIETTIGQLNMFRWILQNDILDYIEKNIQDIENDMIKTQKENQNKRDDNIKIKEIKTETGVIYQKRKKRNQLSKSSVKNMNLFSGQRIVQFD